MQETTGLPSFMPTRLFLVRLALFAIASTLLYTLFSSLSRTITVEPGVSLWFLPPGMALAITIGLNWRYAPVFGLAFLLSTIVLSPHVSVFGLRLVVALVFTLVYGLAAFIAHRLLGVRPTLQRVRDVVSYLLVGMFVPVLTGVLVLLVRVAAGVMELSAIPRLLPSFWVGDAVGIVTLGPFLLIFVMPAVRGWLWSVQASSYPSLSRVKTPVGRFNFALELGIIIGVIAAFAWLTFSSSLIIIARPYFLFLPVVWLSVRHAQSGGSIGALAASLLAAIAIWVTHYPLESLPELQILLLVIASSGLLIGAGVGERMAARADLAASEARFKALTENAPAFISIAGGETHTLVYANQALLDLYGLTFYQLMHSKASNLLSTEALRITRESDRQVLATHQPMVVPELQIGPPGGERWIHAVKFPFDIPGGQTMVGTVSVDITARKIAEQDLRSSEAHFRGVFEYMSEGLLIFRAENDGQDFIIEDINRAGARLTGLSPDQISGKKVQDVFPGITNMETLEILRRVLRTGEAKRVDARYYEDERFSGWFRIAAFKLPGGEIVAIFSDETRQLEIEKELRRHRDSLEDLVYQRTNKLRQALTQVESLSHMKDDFVANVSHELRTPVTNLKLYHYLLKHKQEDQASILEVLDRETIRLNNIIEDLLRLSRLDQGRMELLLVPVDVNSLAHHFARDRKELAAASNLILKTDLARDLPQIIADGNMLEQAIGILLTNALAYTPAGGEVTLFTRYEQRDGKPSVCLGVSDTGPGVPPEEIDLLFERFFRGTAGRESRAPGTGLGLSIVREIVERHNASITVDSKGVPGEGTRFAMWFEEIAP